MINNVQFTGNPAQKGIKIATDAMESFAQSRQQIIKPVVNKFQNEAPAISRMPIDDVAKINKKVDDELVARANSYAVSHGTPETKVVTGKIDYLA